MKHIGGPLSGFETVPSIEAMLAKLDPNDRRRPTKRYPVRCLRYWFVRYLLTGISLPPQWTDSGRRGVS